MCYKQQCQHFLLIFSRLAQRRMAWQRLLVSTLLLFTAGVLFQHGLALAPCVLCIYQRVALLGICLAAGVALCAPHYLLLRVIAVLLWIISASWGLGLAYEQVGYQYHPEGLTSCAFRTQFPPWLALDSWFPAIFRASAMCVQLEGLESVLPHGMLLLFAAYLSIAILVFISQWMSCIGVVHGK